MPPIISDFFRRFRTVQVFHQAHHFVIESLTIISGCIVCHTEVLEQNNEHLHYARLVEHVVASALHNSSEAALVQRCLAETRTQVRRGIMDWIARKQCDGQEKKVLWISGPAGAGKTAIAATIADQCSDDGLLAASFFFSAFSANPYQRSKAKFIATIAYQLLNHHEQIRLKVLAAIERDPVIFDKRLAEQVKSLVLDPLRAAISEGLLDTTKLPQILLVDAIDECGSDQEPEMSQRELRKRTEAIHEEILQTLFSLVEDSPLPFRVILASRPEPIISQFVSTRAQSVVEMFLDNKYSPDHDIEIFLNSKFSAIRERFDIPENWPDAAAIELLVQYASGQFIYAATIVRFIEDPDGNSPQAQLESILDWCPGRVSDADPFEPLDLLYTRILRSIGKPKLAVTWILAIDRLRRETPQCPPIFFKYFLESRNGDTRVALGGLNSLMKVTGQNDVPLFHFYHQSFVDFLVDARRSGQLYVDQVEVDRFLRERWQDTLKSRGPQTRPELDEGESNDFLSWYFSLPRGYRQGYDYTASDMDWWLPRTGTIILVMGETGCGKSHFINVAAGGHPRPEWNSLVPPRDNLEIGEVVLENPSGLEQLILVDTPGFNNYDQDTTDTVILKRVADRLRQIRRQRIGAQFGGIIYLHDITQDRALMMGKYLRHGPAGLLSANLQLSGHLLPVPTKWDRVPTADIARYEAREKEVGNMWTNLLKQGARMARFSNTADSAWEVLAKLIELQPLDLGLVENEFLHNIGPALAGRRA